MAFKMRGWSNSPIKQGGLEYCPECGDVFEGEDAYAQMAQHIFEEHFGGGPGSGTPG